MPDQSYTVKVANNSEIDWQNAIVFQGPPENPADVFSLAWLSQSCRAGTWVEFDWTAYYGFVWGMLDGVLGPGSLFQLSEFYTADLVSGNQTSLIYGNDTFWFTQPGPNPDSGSLFISQGPDIPPRRGCVGIGMSGSALFVRPTGPDGGVATRYTVGPAYRVAIGPYEKGTVITEEMLTCPQELAFPDGKFTADCVFTGAGWEIDYT